MSLSGRERHCVYLNTGDGTFANISAGSGLDFPDDGRGMAATDWDFDGDVDLWISNRTAPRLRFLRNDVETDHAFVAFRLTGNGSSCNRDAIGARVIVRSGEVELMRTLRAGEGFLSQSGKWVRFGLGAGETIDVLEVRWPDGSQETWTDLEPDRFYDLRQGAEHAPVVWSPPERRRTVTPTRPTARASTSAMRLVPASRTRLPDLTYRDLDGAETALPVGAPFLLNLWASWCLPCRAELSELAEAPFGVLALSVDGLGADSPTGPDDARAYLAERSLDLPAGFADEHLLHVLQTYHDTLYLNRRPLPLPTSFLIDADGSVLAIYKGRVDLATIQDDLAHRDDDLEQQRARATPFSGRWLEAPRDIAPETFTDRLATKGLLEPPGAAGDAVQRAASDDAHGAANR